MTHAELQSQSARIAELDALARALVAKFDECGPHIANLSAINYARSGTQYSGPSYGEALEALRVSLSHQGLNQWIS